ncbi:MAG: hypothetical protein J0L62_07390 [Bacteroidetes bacterium]|nr:hypothetical protein [Bacteroidota bacterium]
MKLFLKWSIYSTLTLLLLLLVWLWWWHFSNSLLPLSEEVIGKSGKFSLSAELPLPRTESGGTVCNGKFVVIGGINAFAQTLTSVMIYDPSTNFWETGPDLPEPINHAAVVAIGDTVYVVGGFGPLGIRLRWFMFADWNPLSTVYKLHLPSKTWSRGPDLLFPRGAGGIAVLDSAIWYAGGIDENKQITNTVFKFDLRTNKWSESLSMPTQRDHLRVEAASGELFVISGRKDDLRFNLGTVESFNPVTQIWTKRADIPTARGGLGSAVLNDKIYTFGGEMVWHCLDQMERYDPLTDTWEILDPLPEGRHGIIGGVIDQNIHLIAGGRHPRVSISGIHRVFSPDSLK